MSKTHPGTVAKDEYLTRPDWEQYGQPMWDAHFKETPKESKLKKGDGLFYRYERWVGDGWIYKRTNCNDDKSRMLLQPRR